MKLSFYGADQCVTGSCHCLEVNGKNILIDCGLQQGRDEVNNEALPFHPGSIDFVLITHAHIDHSGLLPLLYAGGFRGEIHATQATVSLCQIMLRDSAHIQEFEAEWRNRKAKRSGGDIYTPLYTMQEALGSLEHFVPHPYGEKISIADGITIRFLDAGHLLGSSSIEIWLEENGISKKLLFSGDIGNFHQPLIRDPQYADTADYVIMESTYGNRLHEKPKNYIQDFVQILLETFQRGGSVIIPSFAVGRTQELLYFLKQIKDQNLLGKYQDVPIYVDSPLAIEATEIFQRNKESCFDEEALAYVQRGENPIGVSGLRTAVTSEASMAINTDTRSKIVISARGRMSGKELQEILLENDHLQMEMAAGSYVIAMTGPGDTQEGMNRLLNALRNLDKRLDEVLQGNRKQDKNLDEVLSGNRKMDAAAMKKDPGFCRHPLIPAERVVESAKVKGRKGLAVPWQEAAGKVSLEFVYLYPPGIPIVVPGERVSEEAVQQILDYEKNGFTIEGTKKKDRLEVLKNG